MKEQKKPFRSFGKLIALCFYLGIAIFCILNREKITLDAIISYTPEKPMLAAVAMLALFLLKGCTVFLNGNLLYAASGILFSLPAAISVNAIGTVFMTAIPFWIGKKAGTEVMDALIQKYQKLKLLKKLPQKNAFVFTLFVRILGILPCEPVGMYLGACGTPYRSYLFGTILGLMPALIMYAVIGAYASDPTSPQFIISAAVQIGTTICSAAVAYIWNRKKKRKSKNDEADEPVSYAG